MLSIEETRALSNMDPEFEQIMKASPTPFPAWSLDTDLTQLRGFIDQLAELANSEKPDIDSRAWVEEDRQITLRDGASIAVRIHKPKAVPEDGCPGMVMYHGGGFVIGNAEVNADLGHLFVEMGGIAVDVIYRHAPEHPFPGPIYDGFDGMKWVAANYKKLGINPKKGFLVGGLSAGADIALTVAHLYRDEVKKGSPPITGIYTALCSATTEESVPEKYRDHFISMEQNAKAPMLSAESMAFIRKHYRPDFKDPLAAPILYDHAGIPKTYFQACGWDPIRDCTLVTEQVWKDAGIPTRLDIYPGIPHAAFSFLKEAQFAKKNASDNKAAFEWLLAP